MNPITVTVKREPPLPPPPATVDIRNIPYETARVLARLLARVGGSTSSDSPRGLLDAIANLLRVAGIHAAGDETLEIRGWVDIYPYPPKGPE